MLRNVEDVATGPHRRKRTCCLRGGKRNILKLKRHHIHLTRKLANRIEIVVIRLDFHIRHLSCGRVRIRRQRMHAVAQSPRRNGKHPAQLARPQNANSRAGKDRGDRFLHGDWRHCIRGRPESAGHLRMGYAYCAIKRSWAVEREPALFCVIHAARLRRAVSEFRR